MNQSSLSIDYLSVQKRSTLNLLEKSSNTPLQGGGYQQLQNKQHHLLCIPKKNGTLRTMFDLWQQNENMWKDVTPFPDQDTIQHDIARAKFRFKLDMTEAYEQMCIRPEDVGKTTFSTLFGTFQSQVMKWEIAIHPPHFSGWWLLYSETSLEGLYTYI